MATAFSPARIQALQPVLKAMNDFRNARIVHVEHPVTDAGEAETHLRQWIGGVLTLAQALRAA